MLNLQQSNQSLQQRFGFSQLTQLAIGNLILDYNTNKVKSHNRAEITLTHKEFYALEYLMKHPNQIVTGDVIRTYLQEMTLGCSCIVADYLRTLRQKFISSGCPSPIESIEQSYYRLKISS